MSELSWIAVLVGTVVAFVIGGGYYAVLGGLLPAPREDAYPVPVTMVVEVVRCLVLAAGVAALVAATGVTGVGAGMLLGALLWIGFPLVLWVGAIVHERTPVRLAAIHAGDWLLKLVAVGAVAGLVS